MPQVKCPSCSSSTIVDGKILADGSDSGSAEHFFPSEIRLLTLKRSVRFVGRENFHACTNCGHVWNTLDAAELRRLIEDSGTDHVRSFLMSRSRKAKPGDVA